MSHPKKYSRTITVGERVYRWRIASNSGRQWEKSIAVYADGLSHSAEVRFKTEAESITPALIRRVILLALKNGFDPADSSTARHLSPEEVLEASHVYPRWIDTGGRRFVWIPDFAGGLHLKIRQAGRSQGQMLATMSTLRPEQLSDSLAVSFIAAGLEAGWQPEARGADCFWLDQGICGQIVATWTAPAR